MDHVHHPDERPWISKEFIVRHFNIFWEIRHHYKRPFPKYSLTLFSRNIDAFLSHHPGLRSPGVSVHQHSCYAQSFVRPSVFLYVRPSRLGVPTGCSGKNVFFFTIHCNAAYIVARDLQSSQQNASVQSLLLAGNFLYNQYQPSAGEGEVANFPEFLEINEPCILHW